MMNNVSEVTREMRGESLQRTGTASTRGRLRHRGILVCWSIGSAVLWFAGGGLTALGLGDWYEALNFPPYQPPGWLFTPMWLVILSLLAVASWKITTVDGRTNDRRVGFALLLYGFQFGLNLGWSLLFFAVRRPDVALWEIIVLDAVVLLMICVYGRISKRAGLLLVPYLVWLLYATAINWWIAYHNGPFG